MRAELSRRLLAHCCIAVVTMVSIHIPKTAHALVAENGRLAVDERLQAATNGSEIVVVAEYQGQTTRHVRPTDTPQGTIYDLENVIMLHPVRWLKGSTPPGTLEVIWSSIGRSPPPVQRDPVSDGATQVIGFLRRMKDDDPRFATTKQPAYLLNQMALEEGAGLLLLSDRNAESVQTAILEYVESEHLLLHSAASELVAVAIATDSLVMCGSGRACQIFHIQDTIVGQSTSRSIRVQSPRLPIADKAPRVIFVNRAAGGYWVGRGAFGGLRQIHRGTLEGSDLSLDQARAKVRAEKMRSKQTGRP